MLFCFLVFRVYCGTLLDNPGIHNKPYRPFGYYGRSCYILGPPIKLQDCGSMYRSDGYGFFLIGMMILLILNCRTLTAVHTNAWG